VTSASATDGLASSTSRPDLLGDIVEAENEKNNARTSAVEKGIADMHISQESERKIK
jgi:hypothetical protein